MNNTHTTIVFNQFINMIILYHSNRVRVPQIQSKDSVALIINGLVI